MGISTEEKEDYLKEAAIVLAREEFQPVRTHTGRLRVLLDDTPLICISSIRTVIAMRAFDM